MTRNNICVEYGPCRKVILHDAGQFSGEWYFLSITPLPKEDQLEKVVYDIMHGHEISLVNGSIIHNPNCTVKNHHLPKKYRRLLKKLQPITYTVAIMDNYTEMLNGQPIAICIDPLISYSNYPEHPHLNAPSYLNANFFPTSLCYTDNPKSLGKMFGSKLFDTMFYVTEWLLRHQIWEKFKEVDGKGKWIGDEAPSGIVNGEYAHFLNPLGACKCGSKLPYSSCCMRGDLELFMKKYNVAPSAKELKLSTDLNDYVTLSRYITNWKKSVELPEKKFITDMKETYKNL